MQKNLVPGRTIPEKIAETLERELATEPPAPGELSIAKLRERFSVSSPTAWRAACILRNKGILAFKKGSRMRLAGSTLEPRTTHTPQPFSSKQWLFAELRGRILDGHYRTGERFPKFDYLARTEHVSTHTVNAVCRMLEREGLIHRRGRAYLIGHGLQIQSRSASVILVLSPHVSRWTSICKSDLTHSFGSVFLDQAALFGVRIVQVVYGDASSEHGDDVDTAARISSQITTDMRTRIQGLLLIGKKAELARINKELRESLLSAQHPIVWLDVAEEGLPREWKSPTVSRCCYSELASIKVAVAALYDAGHRRVVFLGQELHGWSLERARAVLSIAHRQFAPLRLEVRVIRDRRSQWSRPRTTGLIQSLDIMRARANPAIDAALDYFATSTIRAHARPFLDLVEEEVQEDWRTLCACSCAELGRLKGALPDTARSHLTTIWAALDIADLPERCTAIIAESDRAAIAWCRHARSIGIEVPRDLSIVSFDNVLQYRFPLTTVDHGFGYLGFQALHAILGDIATDRNASGDIPARPRLIDNGTVRRMC